MCDAPANASSTHLRSCESWRTSAWRLLCWVCTLRTSLSSVIIQSPDFITASVGESFKLKCTYHLPMFYCGYSVSWYKVNLRNGKLGEVSVHNEDQLDDDKKTCTRTIFNAQVQDSGLYYCASAHDKMIFIGNGTRVVVTGPLNLSVVVYTPVVEEDDPSVLLQCVVMDTVPSQVRVWWLVDDEERTGWTESGWTGYDDSASEYTRAQIRITAEEWSEATIECVVNYKNQTVSRTVPRPTGHLYLDSCMWMLYGGCGVVVFTIAVLITVVLCLRKGGSK
ncbi:immunoglobulin kappa light chain-like [Hemibagrus wyckioides]|uniref:immunoglobulin kappa light chain-like n=1 Tax=Hemibagrus wyckioides TaxID=337641 RepID=UPI00266BC871|nr:immunoglobulin kappa light chain-like [Hemibagrus wyckioides]